MPFVSFVMLLALVISCGKAPNDNKVKPTLRTSVNEPLRGRTKEEILKLKYNGNITLYCALRAQPGITLDITASPTSEFYWDLPSDLSQFKILSYRVGGKDFMTAIKLTRAMEFPSVQNYTDENFREYYMENSPILPIAYKRLPKTALSDGTIQQRMGYTTATLRERVETRLFTKVVESNHGEYVIDVRCTLQTIIQPEYALQWMLVK